MKDDSQVSYVPNIEVKIKPVRSLIYTLFAKDKRERQIYKVFKKSSRLIYFADDDGSLFNEVLDVVFQLFATVNEVSGALVVGAIFLYIVSPWKGIWWLL